jgi:zinc/manganese transport system substrate-binding protein
MHRFLTRALAAGCLAAAATLSALPASAEVRVFACEPEWASLAQEVGGSDVTVYSATHGGQDPHHIRARPSLIAQIRRADLLFCSGAELEIGWLPVLMQRGARLGIQPGQPGYLMAAEHVEVLERPAIIDRSLGDVHASGNPHVHVAPRNIRLLATEFAERLGAIDPDHADAYEARLADFHARWDNATAEWEARAEALRGTPLIVQHAYWSYLFDWLGLERVASMERVSGIPPSAPYLQEVLAHSRSTDVKAIVRANYEPTDAAEWLSERSGLPIVELPSTVGSFPEVTDLFSFFSEILTRLEAIHD